MTAIESESDLEQFESLLGQLWESAIIRYSTVEIEDGTKVPNGEIIFSDEELDQGEEVLYSEGPFEIVEKKVADPLDLLWDMIEGETVIGSQIDLNMMEARVEQKFMDNREARVFDDRPHAELHAVFEPALSDEQENEYSNVAKTLEERLQRAEEPYYNLAKCEYYYFRHHFRNRAKADPEILVFAPTDIEFNIEDEDIINVIIPTEIEEQTAVSVLPQRPYGARKGWRVELADKTLEEMDDGRLQYTANPEFSDINNAYVLLFVEDEILWFNEHYPSTGDGSSHVNSRNEVFRAYDQKDTLIDYLNGDGNVFEIAVLNALSTAGYAVQWFGDSSFDVPNWSHESDQVEYDEVDLIAHHPDGSRILFVECTYKRISEKKTILDRTEEIASVIRDWEPQSENIPRIEDSQRRIVPVIATPQSPEELSEQIVKEFRNSGIVVLHGNRLTTIYKRSARQDEPVEIEIEERNGDVDVF